MLDLDMDREGVPPRDAATLVLVREGAPTRLEVFCVERHKKSGFLGGAVVFPGGKVDESDRDRAWTKLVTGARASVFASGEDEARALAIAACREAFEEAAILPLAGKGLTHEELLLLRSRVAKKETSLLAAIAERGLEIDLGALYPFARWVTPTAESRRFDARFFLAAAPLGQRGAHDDRETTASFWATPVEVLGRFDAGAIQLAPPTHRTLEALATATTFAEAVRIADAANLEPICPRLVRQVEAGHETLALALPGDPEHPVREARVSGSPRFILRGERWVPGDPPRATAPDDTRGPR